MVSTSVSVSGAGTSSTITFSAASSGTGTAILQLSEGSLDFGETETIKSFQVKNVGSDGTTLNWTISTPTVDWLTFNPMSGSTTAGSGTLVTAMIDRSKIHGPVSTTVTVNGSFNNANLSVSATYVDNTLVISDGLSCFFNFDGNGIEDYFGNYTGISAGAVVSTDTPSGEGQSIQLNGSSYVVVQGNIVPGGNAFSINIWFKTSNADQALVGSDQHSGGVRRSALVFSSSANIYYRSYGSGWTTNGTVSNYLDNQWHMMTLTYDGTILMAYVDGSLFETKSESDMKWGSNVNVSYIGADETNSLGSYFTGKLDNFRSYNRALTASEIQTLYNAKQ